MIHSVILTNIQQWLNTNPPLAAAQPRLLAKYTLCSADDTIRNRAAAILNRLRRHETALLFKRALNAHALFYWSRSISGRNGNTSLSTNCSSTLSCALIGAASLRKCFLIEWRRGIRSRRSRSHYRAVERAAAIFLVVAGAEPTKRECARAAAFSFFFSRARIPDIPCRSRFRRNMRRGFHRIPILRAMARLPAAAGRRLAGGGAITRRRISVAGGFLKTYCRGLKSGLKFFKRVYFRTQLFTAIFWRRTSGAWSRVWSIYNSSI